MIDVIVIGAGAGGLAASYKLSSRGMRVVCIDQGPKEYSVDMIDMNEGGELQKFDDFSSNPKERALIGDYPIDCSDSPIEIQNYSGIGGSTMLFSAQYPRLQRSDFEEINVDGKMIKWPISFDDLLKFYEENEKIIELAGLEGDPCNPGIKTYKSPIELGLMGITLAEGFNKLGWKWWPAYAALDISKGSEKEYMRPTNIDISETKATARKAYYQKCIDNGVEFVSCKGVESIMTDEMDHSIISGVIIKDSKGNRFKKFSKFVVVAAGGIGTPRILLNSKQSGWPKGMGNNADMVGKGLMLHPWGYVDGLFAKNLSSMIGAQGCCLLSQQHYKYRSQDEICGGFTLQALRGPWPFEGAKNWHQRKKLKINKRIYENYKKIHDHTAHFAVIVDDEPQNQNRVELDHEKSDAFGIPGVKVLYSMSDKSKQKLVAGIKAAKKVLTAAGAEQTWGFGPVRETGWHTLGTCKMEEKSGSGVTDASGRVHGTKNLYIADGSLITRAGSVNPTNTIQSLGLFVGSNIDQ